MTVVYGPTIARGSGIRSNATHLGLEFEPFIDRETHLVTGVLFRKLHGKKAVFSVSLYDKQANLNQKHQDPHFLTEAQALTVKESVREDITLHSEGIVLIVKKAQQRLESWGAEGLKFFDVLSPEVFLYQEPRPTLWWLQRAIFILSHHRQRGKFKYSFKRYSFGVWLIPFIEDEVLHFDVIANITGEGFHRMIGVPDRVAEAWRKSRAPSTDGWADRLAKAAKCSLSTIYNRRDQYRELFGIDIAFPLQLYGDVLHFGQASTTSPESITKMLAAVKSEDGAALLQLYAEAMANFEHKRVTLLNPALVVRPRAMPLEGPPSDLPELDIGRNALEDLGLSEIDPLEADSVSDPEAWGALPSEERKSTAAPRKMVSPLRKKSIKLKVVPSKFGRLNRRHDF
jgi:hypothetical protein